MATDKDKNLSVKIGYRDSRRAASRILQPGKRFALRRFLLFIAVTVAAVAIWNTLTHTLPPEQRAVLLLFLVAVGLWVTEAVPAFAVGLLIMGYLVFALGTPLIMTEPWNVDPYLDTWSSPVIWLMLGGFFIAEGLSRTGLDRQLFAFAIKPAGTRPSHVLLAVMLVSAVALSNVMSNTATVSLVLPVAVALLPGRELEMCLILGLCGSCALMLPVSTPPNAVAYSTGEIETRDLRPGGLLIGLLGPALIIAWVLLINWLAF